MSSTFSITYKTFQSGKTLSPYLYEQVNLLYLYSHEHKRVPKTNPLPDCY